ncbi:right-handed parallel beta-helix repeat-containing protein [Candidatus Eisenbacteria bacterium]|uniref:Right-handed parallel beta-helix repeat-containing protein n=1 Tax=Eiseniibacteriota bacterium TaxID=2212470 RepID=A0ABV6YQB4_UNCEI
MRAIVWVSVLLIAASAYGQELCPGVYLYADYDRNGCDHSFTYGNATFHMWVYAGSVPIECAEFRILHAPELAMLGVTWDPGVTSVVGSDESGYSVCFSTCDSGWRYLGDLEVQTLAPVDSLALNVTPIAGSTWAAPVLYGCGPEYEDRWVYGGKIYQSGVSHPPCEVITGPDLVISIWSPPAVPDTALTGKEVHFSWFQVRNSGCEDAASFANGYYLSTDAVITAADVLLASSPGVSELDAHGDTLFSDTVLTIPPGIATGEYYIGVLADNSGAVAEDDETNNYVSTPITVLVPRTWHILPDGNGDASTIQAGVDSAAVGDTVLVACGTYHEHDIVMKSGITLISDTGEPDCVRIEADSLGRVIYCDGVDSTTTIEGFTLAEGLVTNAHGGGMYLTYSSPTVRRCNITGNRALGAGYDAGGVRCHYSSPHFIECMFSDNVADDDAGGVYCRNYSSARFDYCVFANNASTDKGGAILCYDNSNAEIYNCTFYGNSAGLGSGIAAMQTSDLLPENVIISFGTGGGSVYCEPAAGCGVQLSCSDVYGNAGGDWIDCIEGQSSLRSNFTADPLFCEPESLDLRLEDLSPCLDAPGCGQVGALGDGCGLAGVGDDDADALTFGLLSSRPNPSGRKSEITFSLSEPARIALAIHDTMGREITVLADRGYEPGIHRLEWDGKDSSGKSVSPGVYFCRLKAGRRVSSQKIVLVR